MNVRTFRVFWCFMSDTPACQTSMTWPMRERYPKVHSFALIVFFPDPNWRARCPSVVLLLKEFRRRCCCVVWVLASCIIGSLDSLRAGQPYFSSSPWSEHNSDHDRPRTHICRDSPTFQRSGPSPFRSFAGHQS